MPSDDLAVKSCDIEAVRDLIYDICEATNTALDETMLEDLDARLQRILPLLPSDQPITPDLLRRLLAETNQPEEHTE
jgi:hypothetical protein